MNSCGEERERERDPLFLNTFAFKCKGIKLLSTAALPTHSQQLLSSKVSTLHDVEIKFMLIRKIKGLTAVMKKTQICGQLWNTDW